MRISTIVVTRNEGAEQRDSYRPSRLPARVEHAGRDPRRSPSAASITALVAAGIVNAIPKPAADKNEKLWHPGCISVAVPSRSVCHVNCALLQFRSMGLRGRSCKLGALEAK